MQKLFKSTWILAGCLVALVVLSIFLPKAFAEEDRCPLTGNVYTFESGNATFELSGFDCTFGPGCQAECDLWWGNFDTGPLHHTRLPFTCEQNGEVLIAGCPCALSANGNLKCLPTVITDYYCYKLGTKTWCLPNELGQAFVFNEK